MYVSEITRFLDELKKNRPAIAEDVRRGRDIWWDKPQDLDTAKRNQESRIPQSGYVYQTKL